MQTRRKGLARSSEHANPKTGRQHRTAAQTVTVEKKVNDLITSSSKKQKSVRVLSNKNQALNEGRNLTSICNSVEHKANAETEVADVTNSTSVDHKHSDDNSVDCSRNSIFSPTFHHPKEGGGYGFAEAVGNEGVSFSSAGPIQDHEIHAHGRKKAALRSGSNQIMKSANMSCKTFNGLNDSYAVHMESTCGKTFLEDEFSELGNLSSEVSAIYLAMQNSKLECIDEQSQDSISTEGCAEPDEVDEFDDFDPYVFIKDLPDLSVVVPKFRPVLLPKQTRSCPATTLVLDLDETLVHSTLEPCVDADFTFPVNFNLREHTIYVRCRPYLKDFLERVASMFETIIFTASQGIYAEQLLNVLDPKRKLFRHRVYRESCVYVEGNYLKDLSVLGRDLAHVVIVDNSPQAFGFQLDNGVPIESWFDDPNDKELLMLLPFLESLVGVEDVRPFVARKFNLRHKVAAASSLTMDFQT